MPNGNLIVADNYPDITVAVDDHALPGWRVAGSCVRAGFGSPLQHLPLTDRSVDVPNIRGKDTPEVEATGGGSSTGSRTRRMTPLVIYFPPRRF